MQPSFSWIPHWDLDRDKVRDRILEQRSILKIILKTKNERHLLERWIRHHLEIVGSRNLIVFDNMSDDEVVAKIYWRYRNTLILARFDGYPDNIHHVTKYRELFESLKESSAFYLFLDTDEYLTWINNDYTFICDRRIIGCLYSLNSYFVIPTTWLANVPYFDDRFYLCSDDTDSIDDWKWGLRWGKPIISARTSVDGNCLHNGYLKIDLFGGNFCTNAFILHLTSLTSDQRISANLRKLIAMRRVGANVQIDEIMQADLEVIEAPLVRQYYEEIRFLVANRAQESQVDRYGDLTIHTIRFDKAGDIRFFNEAQRARLLKLLRNPREIVSAVWAAA